MAKPRDPRWRFKPTIADMQDAVNVIRHDHERL